MFKIPFTISSEDKLKKRSDFFIKLQRFRKNTEFSEYLENCKTSLNYQQYLGICYRLLFRNFTVIFLVVFLIAYYLNLNIIKLPLIVSGIFSFFIFYLQISYPKSYSMIRQRDIEKNLISGLQNMLVQLNSGIPLYNILVNLAYADYGYLSEEFKIIVKRINAGVPQVQVVEESGDKNSSLYFRRALWQISNGMKAGSDLSLVVKESITALEEEQLIQIQNYGSKLNPVIMFYMLITVILPALAITFLTMISSLMGLSQTILIFIFGSLVFIVAFIQVMFLGAIKTMRPTLI